MRDDHAVVREQRDRAREQRVPLAWRLGALADPGSSAASIGAGSRPTRLRAAARAGSSSGGEALLRLVEAGPTAGSAAADGTSVIVPSVASTAAQGLRIAILTGSAGTAGGCCAERGQLVLPRVDDLVGARRPRRPCGAGRSEPLSLSIQLSGRQREHGRVQRAWR